MFKNLLFQILGEAFDDDEVDVAAAVKEEIDVKNEPDEGTESMKKERFSYLYIYCYTCSLSLPNRIIHATN